MWRKWIKRVRLAANKYEYQEQDRQVREQFICGINDEHMNSKIISEINTRSKGDKNTSKQVIMMAIQEECNRTQMWEAGQTSTCRYCGSIYPPRRCPAFGMMCGECGRVNHLSAMCRAPRQIAIQTRRAGQWIN